MSAARAAHWPNRRSNDFAACSNICAKVTFFPATCSIDRARLAIASAEVTIE